MITDCSSELLRVASFDSEWYLQPLEWMQMAIYDDAMQPDPANKGHGRVYSQGSSWGSN